MKLLNKNNVKIRRGIPDVHRQQALVERFNRTLAERLFSHQYYQELHGEPGARSRQWVKMLPEVIKALNNEKTRLIGRKPVEAIADNRVERVGGARSAQSSAAILPHDVLVRYLYSPGELEGEMYDERLILFGR